MPPSEHLDLDKIATAAFAPAQQAIDASKIPGAILGLTTTSGKQAILCSGLAQIVPNERPLAPDNWFDLASLTKVIFTTSKILEAAAAGKINLDAPLTSLLPDFRQYHNDCWERQITFRQCLGHQTPLPAVEPLYTYGQNPATLRAFILQREWRKGPAVYSDINFILLGLALERLYAMHVDEMSLEPGFTFHPPWDISVATEQCTWREDVMRGRVHDENAFALGGAGHAGLFGTINAVLNFATGVMSGNNFSPKTIELMREPLSETRTHGFEHPHTGWSGGDHCSPGTIGHTGFTGTGLWIDFDRGLAWSLLTNRVHPSRHTDSGIFDLRRAVGDIINTHTTLQEA